MRYEVLVGVNTDEDLVHSTRIFVVEAGDELTAAYRAGALAVLGNDIGHTGDAFEVLNIRSERNAFED